MNIDERLDRLAERHEALTQTVELMINQQREWWERNLEWQAKAEQWQEKAEKRQEKNEILMARMLESIDSLARIPHVHERRISDLEGGRR